VLSGWNNYGTLLFTDNRLKCCTLMPHPFQRSLIVLFIVVLMRMEMMIDAAGSSSRLDIRNIRPEYNLFIQELDD